MDIQRNINADAAEDLFRATMNEITLLMGAAPGSAGAERLAALTRMVELHADSLPPEVLRPTPRFCSF